MSAPSDPLIGRTIASKYAIESLIGQGAMGSVYTARHLTLDTVVAVKVLHTDLANDAAFAERFHREAKSASRLHHPNVIQVIDFGREADGLFYIAMEFVNGVDLFQLLQREWPLNDRRTAEITCQILSGIAAAHDIGIVHRDLKPENIIVTRGIDDEGHEQDLVKVCDFGIAKIEEADAQHTSEEGERNLTTRGLLLGTPQYMSPEQCRGDVLDARSDLYSVGIILYQMLTGRLPFQAATTVDVVIKQVTEEPIPPRQVYPRASRHLEEICLRALAKQPEKRFASAREMRGEIRQSLDRPSMFASIDPPGSPSGIPRAALPSPPPHAFAAPTLGQPLESKVDALVTRANGRLGRAWTYALAACIAAGVFSVFWFRSKADATPTIVQRPVGSLVVPQKSPESLPDPISRRAELDVAPNDEPAPSASSHKSKATHRAVSPVDKPVVTAVKEEHPVELPVAHEQPEAPPPPPVAVASVEAPRAPVPPPPVTSMNPEKGQVSWKVSAVGGGATAGGVVRALSRAAGAWTTCYRSGLRARGKSVEGSALLRLTCDDQGRVLHAEVSGFDMPDVSACIRSSTAGVTIPNADTGEAWATVALSFRLRD